MSAPLPVASQWSSLTPFPMNRTPKRFGGAAGLVVSANARDSSHGRPIATPAPRRMVRRERFDEDLRILFTFLFLGSGGSLVEKLRAGDNRLHKRGEPIPVRRQPGLHLLYE